MTMASSATAAPPGPAVRARRPRASGGHPTSPTCRPSARSRGPAVYREYSSVGVCLLHGAYGCSSVQHAADNHIGRHRAPCDRRRACSTQHATTGEACLHVGLPLRHHRLRLENCTARRINAHKHKRSARARRNGASAHCAPPDVRGQPSECATADGWRRRHAASHAHGTARPRWAALKSRRKCGREASPVPVQMWAGAEPSPGADVGRGRAQSRCRCEMAGLTCAHSPGVSTSCLHRNVRSVSGTPR
jgi:hypothetical protein